MKRSTLSEIIINVIILIIGLCLTIWADKVTNLVSILLGCLAILYGIYVFISYFKNNERTSYDTLHFIYAIIVLVIGFILVFRVDFLKELISFVIGIYIVLSSVIKLQEVLKYEKNVINKSKTPIILAVVGIIVGLLCIVGKFLIPDVIIQFIGVMLMLYGIIGIINIFLIKK